MKEKLDCMQANRLQYRILISLNIEAQRAAKNREDMFTYRYIDSVQ